jgi:Leucine-rich repeat (LRR) protein
VQALGAVFDEMPKLVALMLRNNPCMRTKVERMRLMQTMTSLRGVSCSLRYIDSEICMDERVQAWAQASARTHSELELLKQQALLVLCSPPGVPAEHVLELDLSTRRLRALLGSVMAPFTSLRRLLLHDNAIDSLENSALEKLTSLQVLDLRRNQLSDADHLLQIVLALSNLQELGLQGNSLRPRSSSVADERNDAAEQAQTGFGGLTSNLFDVQRMLVSTLAPCYERDPHYPLRFVDDNEIAIEDIVAACELDATVGAKLAFQLTLARQMQDCVSQGLLPPDARASQLMQLDLSDRELSFIDFSQMPRLKRVLLQNNRLDDNALAGSGLQQLNCLEHLDVSFNRVKSDAAVGLIVASGHRFRSLKSVTISHNPCFPSTNLREHRVAFFSTKTVIASLGSPGATLELLNDMPISLTERVDALELSFRTCEAAENENVPQVKASNFVSGAISILSSKTPGASRPLLNFGSGSGTETRSITEAVEDARLTLLLEQMRCSYGSADLLLAQRSLGSLRSLVSYVCVVVLDVRGNELVSLEPLCALPRLARLDVRDNKVTSTDLGLSTLARCDELRHVCLARMSCDWGDYVADVCDQLHHYHVPSRGCAALLYTRAVFQNLPALLDCDGELNPAPLASFQWTALLHLKRVFGVGPNSIRRLDLTARNITKDEFYCVRDWLAFLPITDLRIDQNPFCLSVQSYRYVLINDVRTLDALNGCSITDAERANAFKKVEEMKHDLTYNPPNVESLR